MMKGNHWRTSTRTGPNGNCVEVRPNGATATVDIRDTKNRHAGHLTVSAKAWQAFTRLAR